MSELQGKWAVEMDSVSHFRDEDIDQYFTQTPKDGDLAERSMEDEAGEVMREEDEVPGQEITSPDGSVIGGSTGALPLCFDFKPSTIGQAELDAYPVDYFPEGYG